MKPFGIYQYIPGTPMTDRDKLEVGSKFWNEGKWHTFVAPLLPEDCSEMTFIDMGCNAGLFLKLAEERSFERVVGVDGNKEAVKRGRAYRDSIGGKYKIKCVGLSSCIDTLPVADYTVLANVHYYFRINDWLKYLDRLKAKTRYCIIITKRKANHRKTWNARACKEALLHYFKDWKVDGSIDDVSMEGDPSPRPLASFSFKSPFIERVPIESLRSRNKYADKFYVELDKRVPLPDTTYFKFLQGYREKWSIEKLMHNVSCKATLYEDVRKNGLQEPIVIDARNLIIEGCHRYAMLKHWGCKTVLVRRTW